MTYISASLGWRRPRSMARAAATPARPPKPPLIKQAADQFGTPLYLYDAATIEARYHDLADHIAYGDLAIHYACKANSNPHVIKLLRELGARIETVSEGEIRLALACGYTPDEI